MKVVSDQFLESRLPLTRGIRTDEIDDTVSSTPLQAGRLTLVLASLGTIAAASGRCLGCWLRPQSLAAPPFLLYLTYLPPQVTSVYLLLLSIRPTESKANCGPESACWVIVASI